MYIANVVVEGLNENSDIRLNILKYDVPVTYKKNKFMLAFEKN